jgi:DNA-binding LacI/PurR family transcriptional regulator
VVTLDDVARLAGVSSATVSRTLSRPQMVAASTREAVRSAAERLGYQHNASARALATGRTMLIGFSVPSLASSYFPPLIAGAQNRAEAAGYDLVVADSRSDPQREASQLARLRGRVDAVLLAGTRLADPHLAELADAIPVVTFNRVVPDVPSVAIDTAPAFAELGRRLREGGHLRVAYVGGPAGSAADGARLSSLTAGFGQAVEVFGPVEPTFGAGVEVADLLAPTGVTAAVAYNGLLALGLMHGLGTRGRRIPEDFTVAAGDDLIGSAQALSSLMTVLQPVEEAGRDMVDIVLAQLDSTAPESAATPRRTLTARADMSRDPEREDPS